MYRYGFYLFGLEARPLPPHPPPQTVITPGNSFHIFCFLRKTAQIPLAFRRGMCFNRAVMNSKTCDEQGK